MNHGSFLDNLNLRPTEKRIIFVITVVVFFVLNFVLVWPHFSDWGRIKKELDTTTGKFRAETNEIGRDVDPTNGYKKQLAKLEREQKGGVSQVYDEALLLQKTVGAQAPKCHVDISSRTPGTSLPSTNEFFDEQTLQITFEAEESNLVNFLYNVGNDPSMVRIRELRLDPVDPGRYKLRGTILLAANYEKRALPAAAPKPSFQPGAKPTPGGPPAKAPGNGPALKKNPNAPPGALPRTKL
jgi:hypothetical protein